MPADESSRGGVFKGRVPNSAAIALAGRPAAADHDIISAACRAWFRADGELEVFSWQWSELEAEVLRSGRPESAATAVQLRRLERRIASIDRTRSRLLHRIRRTQALTFGEVMGKLLVAERLLEGEGGAEHELVADARLSLSAAFMSRVS